MEQFNAEAKALVEMQNEYVLLTGKNPSEMCHDDFIRAEELNRLRTQPRLWLRWQSNLPATKKTKKACGLKNNSLAVLFNSLWGLRP